MALESAYGVEVAELPEGTQPIEVIVVVKALSADGEVSSFMHTSAGISQWEKIGLLQMYADLVRAQAVDNSESVSYEDDESDE
jgi:hypothetical protein